MKRSFKLSELDCANCAAKMEAAINKLDAVDTATINFMSQRLTIEAAEDKFEEVLDQAQKAINKVERDCKIVR
ncbi:cation transporter [bacterium 210820-DFI.6.37]|nr:cation transporter [bacterium 210820-DFI.6.37]